MLISPVAFFHSPLTSKFGLPRQSGVARSLQGTIVLEPAYRHAEAVRGLEDFDYLWLIWEFSANRETSGQSLTVRPPRLGGNERVGVFASRSPYRPNRLGLSAVKLAGIDFEHEQAPLIHVEGADLMDGTPIYDIKPYVSYADSYPSARSGFVDDHEWQPLQVTIAPELCRFFNEKALAGLRQVLSQDPRPQYHDDPQRIYGMPFGGYDIRFRVVGGTVEVVDVV